MLHLKDMFESDRYIVHRLCIGAFAVNSYILICKESREACVIDPGGETDAFKAIIEAEKATLRYILATHAHIDHVMGVADIKKAYPKAKFAYHADEQIVVDHLDQQSEMFDFPKTDMPPLEHDLKAEPKIVVGQLQIQTISTPGHTPGGVSFYLTLDKLLFTGDLLFKGSVGRTDFEGGNGSLLKTSLIKIIKEIPQDVKILAGHGKHSNVGHEIKTNLYLRIEQWR